MSYKILQFYNRTEVLVHFNKIWMWLACVFLPLNSGLFTFIAHQREQVC